MVKFVYDLHKNGAKSKKPGDLNIGELFEMLNGSYDEPPIGDGKPPNLHECFNNKDNVKPYIDYDAFDSEKSQSKHIRFLKSEIKRIFPQAKDILYATRSGFSMKHNKYKISLRAYVNDVGYFSNAEACGHFFEKQGLFKSPNIDKSAYKSRQNMGILYNTKMGDPRILEPLNAKGNRVPFSDADECKSYFDRSIIQVGDVDNAKCIDHPDFQSDSQKNDYVVIDNPDDTKGIKRVVKCAKKLMPNTEVIRIKDNGAFQVLELVKTNDECPICDRAHSSNRAYCIYYPEVEKAFFKCHSNSAKNKRITLFDDTMKNIVDDLGTGIPDDSDLEISDVDDSPNEARRPKTPVEILLDSDFTDEDIAEYWKRTRPNEFIYFNNNLFRFKAGTHYWKRYPNLDVISKILGKKVFNECSTALKSMQLNGKRYNEVSRHMLLLRSWSKRKGAVECIRCEITEYNDIFDMKPNLIGFENGVYDLEENIFRPGQYDDYITFTTGYDYHPPNEQKRRVLESFIGKIMPREDEKDFLMRAMASGLYGQTQENMFILTGEGGNGKDTLLTKLYKNLLGRNYYYYANNTVLTDKRKHDLNQNIANMHKKRAIVWSEIAKNSILQSASIKELTGCDEINARGLYSQNTSTLLKGSCFLCCNDIPKIDSIDGGVQRRLMIIPFRSLFKKPEEIEAMVNTVNVYEGSKYYESVEFRNEYRTTFFNMLVEYFQIYKRDGMQMRRVPRSIQSLNKQYLTDSDDFMTWFLDNYEKKTNNDMNNSIYVRVSEVFKHYKLSELYQNLTKSEKRSTTKNRFIEDIKKNSTLRTSFVVTPQLKVNGKRKQHRNCLIGWRLSLDEDSESDSDSD